MSDLKPCPFCGNEMEIIGGGAHNRPACKTLDRDKCVIGGIALWGYPTEEAAIAAWNRRVAFLVEEVVEELKWCNSYLLHFDFPAVREKINNLIARLEVMK